MLCIWYANLADIDLQNTRATICTDQKHYQKGRLSTSSYDTKTNQLLPTAS